MTARGFGSSRWRGHSVSSLLTWMNARGALHRYDARMTVCLLRRLQPEGHAQSPEFRTQGDLNGPDRVEVARPCEDFLQGDRQFQSRKPGAGTVMGAATKCQ